LEAASAETIISGAEVLKPTITMPINSGGMPKWRAAEAEPSTRFFSGQSIYSPLCAERCARKP
jgi:hypothetical protein